MKKIIKSLLVFVFAVVSLLPILNAKADEIPTNGKNDNSGKITITNAIKDQEYSVYQVLVLESYDTVKEAYTYKVETTSPWYEFLTTGEGSSYVNVETGTNIVTWTTGADEKAFAEKAIDYAKANSISATASKKAESATVEFTGLNLGYYLVDSSLGALCNLTTTNPEIEIVEKNGIPTVDKEVKEDSTKTFGSTNNDEIGKTICFQTTINAQNGAENYVLYDKMDAGLTLNAESITIVLKRTDSEDKTLVLNTDYTVSTTTEGYTFVVDFKETFEKTLISGDAIVVSYNAILNENAVVGGTGNKNETHLKYGDNNESNYDETRTYTFSFDLIKVNNKNEQLSGAEFNLYDAKTGGNMIALVKDGNTYRVATEAEKTAEGFVSATIIAGSVTIEGLDDDASYYLEETVAPDGYNKLTSRVEVRLNAQISSETNESTVTLTGEEVTTVEYSNDTVSIINITGDLLPSTGGMGTVLFVTIGSLMVLGFGVILVTKLRMSKMAL